MIKGGHSSRTVSWLITLLSQEAERHQHWHAAHFLLFVSPGPPAHGMVLPTLRMGCVSLVKTFWKDLERHIQKCVPMVILNAIKLTMKMESHLAFDM